MNVERIDREKFDQMVHFIEELRTSLQQNKVSDVAIIVVDDRTNRAEYYVTSDSMELVGAIEGLKHLLLHDD